MTLTSGIYSSAILVDMASPLSKIFHSRFLVAVCGITISHNSEQSGEKFFRLFATFRGAWKCSHIDFAHKCMLEARFFSWAEQQLPPGYAERFAFVVICITCGHTRTHTHTCAPRVLVCLAWIITTPAHIHSRTWSSLSFPVQFSKFNGKMGICIIYLNYKYFFSLFQNPLSHLTLGACANFLINCFSQHHSF